MQLIKVSAHSPTLPTAGAIAGIIRAERSLEIQAFGASAVKQAVKAIATVMHFRCDDESDTVCAPQMIKIEIDGEEEAALLLGMESRSGHGQAHEV